MKLWSISGLKRLGSCVPILLIAGVASPSCKEDLDEARSALAATTKERDALAARVASLEHELATTRAELEKRKTPSAEGPGAHGGIGPVAATPSPAVAGKTATTDTATHLGTAPRTPSAPHHGRPKS